jgi:5-methylcytosine-specific restriction endonuclease McrA
MIQAMDIRKDNLMANRFQANQYALVLAFVAERDGEHCLICQRPGSRVKLQVDHADNDPTNFDPANLHLMCGKCNCEKRQMTIAEQKRLIKKYSAKNERERERHKGTSATNTIRAVVDYKSGSVEMQASSYFEPHFREWVLQIIIANGFIIKREAINSGAEFVGCSTIATKRYLDKMTSAVGNLIQRRDGFGMDIIEFKDKPKRSKSR